MAEGRCKHESFRSLWQNTLTFGKLLEYVCIYLDMDIETRLLKMCYGVQITINVLLSSDECDCVFNNYSDTKLSKSYIYNWVVVPSTTSKVRI